MELQSPPDPLNDDTSSDDALSWLGSRYPAIRCAARVLRELSELASAGFQRYPWGGVEIGGLLLGRQEPGLTLILDFRSFDCEHEYGPSFELTAQDLDRFTKVIEDAASGPADTRRIVPVGWFYTTSRQELGLSQRDRSLHEKLFPEPRHLALVLQRSSTRPLEIGFFTGNSSRNLQLHSPVRQFPPEETPPLAAKVASGGAGLQSMREQPVLPTETANSQPLPAESGVITIQSEIATLYASLGLNRNPFSAALDVQLLHLFGQQRKAISSLLHKIQNREGFVVLIGTSGVGKSLLLEFLMNELKARAIEFAYLPNSAITVPEFYQLITHDLDLKCERDTKAPVLIALNEYLIRRFLAGQTTALIVDNAEQLSVDLLNEIQLIGNLEASSGRLLQVVLAAQPELEKRLRTPELRGLDQRILIRSRLSSLDASETGAYITNRLEKAGLPSQTIFSSDLMLAIHTCTQGVPRLINAVCSGILELCLDRQCSEADRSMLSEASTELGLDGRVSDSDE